MTKDEAWDMIDSALDHCYPEKDVLEIKKTLAKQDAETNLQAVSDFGQLQALSEPSECWDCRCLQENEQDNDVICDLCRWAKEPASQPAQEPVAWIDDNGNLHRDEPPYSYGPDPRPLYLVPPQRQPLRGEQIYELFVKTLPKLTLGMTYVPEWAIPIARAIELHHGIGDKA